MPTILFRRLTKTENIKLIEHFQKYPPLFDINSMEYRDRTLITNIFGRISSDLNIHGITVESFQTLLFFNLGLN